MFNRKKLYLITDEKLEFNVLYNKCSEALSEGVKLLQYRKKDGSFRERIYEAEKLMELCSKMGAKFIINDRVDIALAINADGVHLGQEDMDISMARRLLGGEKIIGVTAKTVEQALEAYNGGADYIGVGAIYPSKTKENAVGITIDTLREIRNRVPIPIYGIGGITRRNITQEILELVDGVCVVAAIFRAEDAGEETRRILEVLK